MEVAIHHLIAYVLDGLISVYCKPYLAICSPLREVVGPLVASLHCAFSLASSILVPQEVSFGYGAMFGAMP